MRPGGRRLAVLRPGSAGRWRDLERKGRGTCEGSLGLLPPGSDPVRNLAAPRANPVYSGGGTRLRKTTQCLIVAMSSVPSTRGGPPRYAGGLPAKSTTVVATIAENCGRRRAKAAFAAASVR